MKNPTHQQAIYTYYSKWDKCSHISFDTCAIHALTTTFHSVTVYTDSVLRQITISWPMYRKHWAMETKQSCDRNKQQNVWQLPWQLCRTHNCNTSYEVVYTSCEKIHGHVINHQIFHETHQQRQICTNSKGFFAETDISLSEILTQECACKFNSILEKLDTWWKICTKSKVVEQLCKCADAKLSIAVLAHPAHILHGCCLPLSGQTIHYAPGFTTKLFLLLERWPTNLL